MFSKISFALQLAFASSLLLTTIRSQDPPKPKEDKLLDQLPDTLDFFISGFTKDILSCTFNTKLNIFGVVSKTSDLGDNPTWLTLDRSRNVLFSTHEVGNFEGRKNAGGVVSSSIGKEGQLTKLSSAISSESPVASDLSPDGKCLIVANYNGGSLTVYDVDPEGKLSPEPVQTIAFKGSGPVKSRQGAAFVHQARFDPSGKLVLVTDLGADRVHVFAVQSDGKLEQKTDIVFKPGSGPRHMEFAQTTSGTLHVYFVLELANDLATFEVTDIKEGKFKGLQTIPTLNPVILNITTYNAGEISITPDKKFVYVSNRNKDPKGKIDDNNLGIYERNLETGLLKKPIWSVTGGKEPRHFTFSPDRAASLVLVANTASNLLVMHRRNATSGKLTEVAAVGTPKPAMVLFRY